MLTPMLDGLILFEVGRRERIIMEAFILALLSLVLYGWSFLRFKS